MCCARSCRRWATPAESTAGDGGSSTGDLTVAITEAPEEASVGATISIVVDVNGDGLSSALDGTIRNQARQLLAADLAVSSRRPIAPDVFAAVDGLPGVRRIRVQELPSVVSALPVGEGEPGASVLCELKAVGDGYPFYGELLIEPAEPLDGLLDTDHVVVAPELLARLDLGVGDKLRIGGELFAISGIVTAEPDRMGASFAFGPRVLLSLAALERTG